MMLSFVIFLFISFWSHADSAYDGVMDLNLNATSVTLSQSTSRKNLNYFVRTGISLYPSSDSSFLLGGGMSYYYNENFRTETEQISITDYYFSLRWTPNKRDKWFWLGFNFSPNSTAEFKSGSADKETWKGSSYLINTTLYYPTLKAFLVGLSFDYYNATYTTRSTSSTSSSSAQTVTGIFPSLSFGYSW